MDLGLLSYFALKLHFSQLLIGAPPLLDSVVSCSPLLAFALLYQVPFHSGSLRDFCCCLNSNVPQQGTRKEVDDFHFPFHDESLLYD